MANNIRNAELINKELEKFIDKEIVGPAVNSAFNDMVNNSPYESGQLQGSWQKEKIKDNEYRIRNVTEYISYVINGTANRLPNFWVDNAITRWLGIGRRR